AGGRARMVPCTSRTVPGTMRAVQPENRNPSGYSQPVGPGRLDRSAPGRARSPRAASDRLRSLTHSGVAPALERGDLLLGPGSVAWHRAAQDLFENRVCVRLDVVVGPEVEGELHRLAIAPAKQRLDVLLEADRFAGLG